MNTLSIFKEATIEKGKRILKVFQYGAKTADECAPFGIDANPIKDMKAVYLETSNDSESVIVGYLNDKQIAASGEVRLYSLDSQSTEKTYIWLKNNGNLELNGNQYTSVRFEPLKIELQNKISLLNAELLKVQAALAALGGVYVNVPITLDLSQSESLTVKLK